MFSLLAVLFLASPGWITSCAYSHSLPDDPIVFFGQPGLSHLHDFVGAKTTSALSSPGSMRAGGTTCAMPGDASGYWIPRLYIHNGSLSLHPNAAGVKNALFYYRRKGIGSSGNVRTIPDGLKMVLGNGHADTPAQNPLLGTQIIFKCGLGSSTNLAQPPSQCPDGNMSVSLTFPNCWDGKNLDSPDHISHMAYPAGNSCPASHPVVLPRIESFFRYAVGTAPLGVVSWSSGPWYTLHQDFLNAWEPGALQHFIDKCVNSLVDCGKNPVP